MYGRTTYERTTKKCIEFHCCSVVLYTTTYTLKVLRGCNGGSSTTKFNVFLYSSISPKGAVTFLVSHVNPLLEVVAVEYWEHFTYIKINTCSTLLIWLFLITFQRFVFICRWLHRSFYTTEIWWNLFVSAFYHRTGDHSITLKCTKHCLCLHMLFWQ